MTGFIKICLQKDDEDADDNDSESSLCSEASSQMSNATPGKKKKAAHYIKKGGALPTKILKKKKLKKSSKKKEEIAMWEFKPGDSIPCEVICTKSYVEVVWQVIVFDDFSLYCELLFFKKKKICKEFF